MKKDESYGHFSQRAFITVEEREHACVKQPWTLQDQTEHRAKQVRETA